VRLILDNERKRAKTLTLPFPHSVHGEVLSATRPGLIGTFLPSHGGRVRVKLAADSVLAILPS
jgi:hypothetical protein